MQKLLLRSILEHRTIGRLSEIQAAPCPYLRRSESSRFGCRYGRLPDNAATLSDTAEREGCLCVRHTGKARITLSPVGPWRAETIIPRSAGKRRRTMGPICLRGSEPWAGAVTHSTPRREALGFSRSPAWRCSCRLHRGPLRDHAGGDIAPERDHQLARQDDNGDAPCGIADPLKKPMRQSALRRGVLQPVVSRVGGK